MTERVPAMASGVLASLGRPAARRRRLVGTLRRDRTTMVAGLILLSVIAGSVVLPEVLPYRYDQQSLDHTFEGSSGRHWLGTDQYGRDLLTRLAQGGRISLLVAVVTVLAEVLLGGSLGAIAGYAGGILDEWLMRLTDMMLAFPALLLALLFAAILGPGTATVIAALTLAGWPAMARTVRGEILSLKEREFVVAARAQGASAARILLRHLLRNTVHLIVVRATLDSGPIILTEATLSFLGLGRAAADAVLGRPDRRFVPVPPERAGPGRHSVPRPVGDHPFPELRRGRRRRGDGSRCAHHALTPPWV